MSDWMALRTAHQREQELEVILERRRRALERVAIPAPTRRPRLVARWWARLHHRHAPVRGAAGGW